MAGTGDHRTEYIYEPKPAHPLDMLTIRGTWEVVRTEINVREVNARGTREVVTTHFVRPKGK